MLNRAEFIAYVEENFDVSGEYGRLLNNVLIYAENSIEPENQHAFLCDMLEGTIGLSEAEIRKINL